VFKILICDCAFEWVIETWKWVSFVIHGFEFF
jgi:hypothetical protein